MYDTTPELDERFFPPDYLKEMPVSARKALSQGQEVPVSPYRKAVPDYIDMNAWRRAAAANTDFNPKLKDRNVDPFAGNVEDYRFVGFPLVQWEFVARIQFILFHLFSVFLRKQTQQFTNI